MEYNYLNTWVGPEVFAHKGKNSNSIMASFLLSTCYISLILILMKFLKDSKIGITILKFLFL